MVHAQLEHHSLMSVNSRLLLQIELLPRLIPLMFSQLFRLVQRHCFDVRHIKAQSAQDNDVMKSRECTHNDMKVSIL